MVSAGLDEKEFTVPDDVLTAWRAAGKRGSGRGGAALKPETPQRPEQERRFVDIDPWAVLLEQLMEVPEEQSAERKGGKRE